MPTKKHKIAYQYLYFLLFLSLPTLTISQGLENALYYGEDFFY